MIRRYVDYHIRRIVLSTMDLWKEENSICKKCHSPDSINCLLCYCPRYDMGTECGGNFVILENGIKDCSDCTIPHDPVFVEEYLKYKLGIYK
ncbi:MAG: Cysteine-rich small domain protein [Bacteroidetes bacterium ADurb.Bin302]|nr:MAG: Cysteine-rich small domain protein [Bacteroidetes bacterium ADurb.Bin302]